MKNPKVTRKITQGMYVLTTDGGGCVVDAVARISGGEHSLIAVAVAKGNHTHELMQHADKFGLSILGERAKPELIETFGFCSGRDRDKFANLKTQEVEGVKVLEDTLGYMVMKKVDAIKNDTHTLFIGELIEGDIVNDKDQPMSYAYYQDHKEDLKKTTTEQGKTAWVCTVCGYVYYGDEVPDDYRCPLCGLGKEYFKKKED